MDCVKNLSLYFQLLITNNPNFKFLNWKMNMPIFYSQSIISKMRYWGMNRINIVEITNLRINSSYIVVSTV